MAEISYEQLRALTARPEPPSKEEREAIARLLSIARRDTGQSGRVASFLLAWWNATSCGGFDLTDMWAVDANIADDMLTVVRLIARVRAYPPDIEPALAEEFRAIVELWRPALIKD